MDEIKTRFSRLIDVKSIVTITMTVVLAVLLLGNYNPPKEVMALFCTSYGAITTYFFTRKPNNG
jgi:hypothetical protein